MEGFEQSHGTRVSLEQVILLKLCGYCVKNSPRGGGCLENQGEQAGGHCKDPGEDGVLSQGGSWEVVEDEWIPAVFLRRDSQKL